MMPPSCDQAWYRDALTKVFQRPTSANIGQMPKAIWAVPCRQRRRAAGKRAVLNKVFSSRHYPFHFEVLYCLSRSTSMPRTG